MQSCETEPKPVPEPEPFFYFHSFGGDLRLRVRHLQSQKSVRKCLHHILNANQQVFKNYVCEINKIFENFFFIISPEPIHENQFGVRTEN